MDTLGRIFPTSPMLAAVVRVANIMDEDLFLEEMRHSYKHKFASKPEVIEGNMKALKISFEEVQG